MAPHTDAFNITPAAAPAWTARLRNFCLHLLLLLSAGTVSAATYTWTGAGFNGDTDYKWSNPWNWQGLSAPQPGEQGVALVFPNSGAPRNTTNDVLNLVISSVVFQGANYGIHGGPNGITMTLLGAGGGNFAIVSAANNCQFGLGTRLHLGSTGAVAVASGSTLLIKSRISGVPGFSKLSPGTLSLQATQANTFFGTVQVLDGSLVLKNQGVSVPGALIIGDADPSHSASVVVSVAGQIADTSAVTVSDNGELIFADVNDTIGSLTLLGGDVDTSNGTLTLNGDVKAQGSSSSVAGQIYGHLDLGMLTRSFTVSNANSQLYIWAQISGGNFGNAYAGLTKLGAGRLVLASSNSYPGYTAITEGIVSLQNAATPGSTNRGTTVAEGAELHLFKSAVGEETLTLYGNTSTNPFVVFAASNSWAGPLVLNGTCVLSGPTDGDWLTLSGAMSGPGTLHKVGAGTLKLAGSSPDSLAGGIEVDAGVVRLAKTAPIPGPLHVGRPGAGVLNYAPASVVLDESGQLDDGAHVAIHFGAKLDLNGNYELLDSLRMDAGTVETGSGILAVRYSITNVAPLLPGVINGHLAIGTYVDIHTETNSALLLNADIESLPGGSGELRKVGAGRLTFTKAHKYEQATRILEGELELVGPANLGKAPVVHSSIEPDGLLTLNNSSNLLMYVDVYPHFGRDAVHYRGTNYYDSYLLFGGGENIIRAVPNPFETNAHLTVGHRLGNAGGGAGLYGPVIFDGPGTVHIYTAPGNIPQASLYYGSTWLKEGTLLLDHPANDTCIPTELTIGQDSGPVAIVKTLADEQIKDSVAVTIKATGRLDLDGHKETIHSLSGGSNAVVRLANGELVVDGASGASTFEGFIFGVGGRLTKAGLSTFTLAGNNSYTGPTTVTGGKLYVNGNQTQSQIALTSGGMLCGNGRVGVINSVLGTVQPGTNVGVLRCFGYSSNALLATLRMELSGATPGTGHDQLDVTGPVNLQGTSLELKLNGAGAVSNRYVIVKNDGVDLVTGNFAGLSDGATFTANGASFQIVYNDGDGNDVVVIQKSIPAGPQIGAVNMLVDGTFQITATGVPNAAYNVEATTSLTLPVTWMNLGNANANGAGLIEFVDVDSPNYPQRFYRFVQQ